MSRRSAWCILGTLVLLLLVGTLMPGAWRNSMEYEVHATIGLSTLAHFALFAGMGVVTFARPLSWSWGRVVMAALALALLSEGLQFVAIDRHPRWLDVGVDMAGALVGMALARWVDWLLSGRCERS